MSDLRWERIKSIFNDAMALPAAQRHAFIESACAGDAELRNEVQSLMESARPTRDPGALRTGGAAHAVSDLGTTTFERVVLKERPGTTVGPYKLLQPIGEGGFGMVFLAEQTVPVRRRVALKVIKLGMDTKAVVARFEAERQALALMDHPHIARVLDGGATEHGRPYFVMEYVVGDPITKFADQRKLSVPDRLALFAQVCSAVQHAHTKGVIHRDIKPANVLVSMVDGKPFAKVIDFGIAKATASPLTDKTLFTEHKQLIGTPEYMSPEQAEGSNDIDTRTDVYALGVLLYELLTGATPFDAERLRSAAWGEMQRIIREEEPLMPSVRLNRDQNRDLAKLISTAAARAEEPSRLGTLLKGELDWIVMKALDKDRGRRYESPNQLAADVQRHLAGEAVVAAPVSKAYRLRKFVKRNRGSVMAGGAVAVALLAGMAATTWQWRTAREQVTAAEDALGNIVAKHSVREGNSSGVVKVVLDDDQRTLGHIRVDDKDDRGFPLEHPRISFFAPDSASMVSSDSIRPGGLEVIRMLGQYAANTADELESSNASLLRQRDEAIETLTRLACGLAQDQLDSGDRPEDGVFAWVGSGTRLPGNPNQGVIVRIGNDGKPELVFYEGPASAKPLNTIDASRVDPHVVTSALQRFVDGAIEDRAKRRQDLQAANDSLTRQRDIAREAIYEVSKATNCDVCDELGARSLADAFMSSWMNGPRGAAYKDAPDEERQLRALADFSIYNASRLFAETKRARLAEASIVVEAFGRAEPDPEFLKTLDLPGAVAARMQYMGPVHADTIRAEMALAGAQGKDRGVDWIKSLNDWTQRRAAAGEVISGIDIRLWGNLAGAYWTQGNLPKCLEYIHKVGHHLPEVYQRDLRGIDSVVFPEYPVNAFNLGGFSKEKASEWALQMRSTTLASLFRAKARFGEDREKLISLERAEAIDLESGVATHPANLAIRAHLLSEELIPTPPTVSANDLLAQAESLMREPQWIDNREVQSLVSMADGSVRHRSSAEQSLARESKRARLAESEVRLSEYTNWETPPRDKAIKPLIDIYNTRKELLGESSIETIKALWMIGALRFEKGELDRGLVDLRFAVGNLEVSPSRPIDLLAALYDNLLHAELVMGNLDEATSIVERLGSLISTDEALSGNWTNSGIGPFRPHFLYTPRIFTWQGAFVQTSHAKAIEVMRQKLSDFNRQSLAARYAPIVRDWALGTNAEPGDPNWAPYLANVKLRAALTATNLAPTDPEAHTSLALWHYRAGEYTKALPSIRRAIEFRSAQSDDSSPIAAAAEAMICFQIGDEVHLAFARAALARAKSLPLDITNTKPWARSNLVKPLLAEAEALIEGPKPK